MNKKIFTILAILILVGVEVWLYQNQPDQQPPYTEPPTQEPPTNDQTDFEQTGNIVKNNPGMKQEVWYLIYEEPGSPGLSIELNR